MNFLNKLFLMFYSFILLIEQIICILWLNEIIYFPVCDIKNFEINLNFPWPKNQGKNLSILRTKRASKVK